MAKVITFGNFKGGTGKTTNCVMTGYALSKLGYKVLIVDKDPQANATTLLYRTHESETGVTPKTDHYLLDGVINGSFENCVVNITENLDVLPTTPAFSNYPKTLEKMFKGDSNEKVLQRIVYFKKLLEPLKSKYDYILIDVPPTISDITDSALMSTDYVVIVLQTQERSLQGAEIFIDYLQQLIDKYEATLDIAGILPVILKSDSKIDQATLINAKNIFGEENLFNVEIKMMERLKRYDSTGITNTDHHDSITHKVYENVALELLERIGSEVTA